MKRTALLIILLLSAATCFAAAPSITSTTVWTDTSFAGPYVVQSVIKCADGLKNIYLGYQINNAYGSDPWSWWDWPTPDSSHVDTFYFTIPVIPVGIETPPQVDYMIYAENNSTSEWGADPAYPGFYTFANLMYSPVFSSVSALRDTFYTGPYVVKTNLTTAFGDSVTGDYIYSDVGPGGDYYRDSVGVDGFYYYSIPRLTTNSQTPVTIQWFLTAYDTLGYWAQYPEKRDTMNHFTLIDPMPLNIHTIADTSYSGPFPVWVTYKSEGNVVNDSLWVFEDGTTWVPYGRDSLVSGVYYYTIPAQDTAVINPILVRWYLKATDETTGNYTYMPPEANPSTAAPYIFKIYDWQPPLIWDLTLLDNNVSTGPFEVTAKAADTSGISQVRLYFRAEPFAEDTTWHYLPMFPTTNANEFRANIPVQYPDKLVSYYVTARDGALMSDGSALWNLASAPAGDRKTPYQFFTGTPDYKLLLVNDALASNDYETYYTACLDTNGVIYGSWDNRIDNVLPILHNFTTLIWFTGDDSLNTLNQSDRDSLSAFLDRGGNLLLSSKNLGQNLGGKVNSDTAVFYHDYLKAHLDSISTPLTSLNFPGRVALPISRGSSDSLYVGTLGTAGNYRSIDRISPLSGADSVFNVKNLPSCAVIRCSTGVYKTVYTTAPLEAIAKTSAGKMSRTTFIGRCLSWFGIQSFYKVEGEAVSEAGLVHDASLLYQAYPNPFGSSTTISFNLPADGQVSLKVYNVLGQVVKTVCDGQRSAGIHKLTWSGEDESGRKVSNGIYLYRLVTNDQNQTKKVIVLR